jgi:hypothetical protein
MYITRYNFEKSSITVNFHKTHIESYDFAEILIEQLYICYALISNILYNIYREIVFIDMIIKF